MKVLITGADGFIGTSLKERLKFDHLVITQGRVSGKLGVNKNHFQVNVDAQSDWMECLYGVDVIIHLAASAHNKKNNQMSIDEVNIDGTIRLAQQALSAGVKRFIFISSIGVLGNNSIDLFDERTPESPHSEYSISKLKAEKALLGLSQGTSLEIVIIRPVLVYGRDAPGNFSNLNTLISKVPILPFGLSDNKRSFISIDNLVGFIFLCLDHPEAKNEVFCISDDADVSIKEFTNCIATGLSKNIIQLPVPIFFIRVLGRVLGRQGQVEQLLGNLQVDVSKAKALLGWVPCETIDQAMKKLS